MLAEASSACPIYTYWFHHCRFLITTAECLHIIHSKSHSLLHQSTVQPAVSRLQNSLECAIFRRLEVDRGGPIVAEVLGRFARCAFRYGRRIKVRRVQLI
jgi:hypothetical protein